MDTAIYHDTGGKSRFSNSKFDKSNSVDDHDVPIDRLVKSMELHLLNVKSSPLSLRKVTREGSAAPKSSGVICPSNGIFADGTIKDEQLASQLDRSFCLNLDHQTLTTLMNSENKSIKFEIPTCSHPRLDTPFYNALRKKYPKAFIRRASLSSLFSDVENDVVGSSRKPKNKPGLPPKPRKLLDQSISGSSKRLHNQYGSTVSLNMDMPSTLKQTDSLLSLKKRLQQNQNEWKKVLAPGLSPFQQHRFQKHLQVLHSRSASVPNAMSVDMVPADAPVLVPKEEDVHFEDKSNQKHVYQAHNRRFASPDSSHDSAVDMDTTSLQSSPISDQREEGNRLSRQQNRSAIPTKDRPPRSRTPKLKYAQVKLPNASGTNSTRSMSVPESDGDSGIAAAHWANPLSVDTSTPVNEKPAKDHMLIIKNDLNKSAISSEGVRSSLDLLEGMDDLRSSREKVKFADDQVDLLNTSERYMSDDDSTSIASSQETSHQRMSTFKPNGPIETLSASTRRKKATPVLAPKPPLPKPGRSNFDNTSEVSFYSTGINGGRKAKKEKKKSLLPWKRSKGKYTPSKEELSSPMMTPSASPMSVRSFATVNARPKRPSSVIESLSMDEESSQGNVDDMDESLDDTEFEDDDDDDDDDYMDQVDYSSKPPKAPSSCVANDSQEISNEPSNLQRSKELSGSRTSLKEQFGNWRDNAKQKMGRLRRAISTEKVDKQNGEKDKEKKTSEKMKKSPSLSNLFKRSKGKSGDSKKPPSGSQSSFRASKRSLTKEDLNSDPNQTPQNVRSIGKLKHVNDDGTQIIELARPKDGPMGFYVAKGNAQYNHGFFISRLSDALPDYFFAGIMTVGDEILEINGRKVEDMPLEGVYDLLGHSDSVVLRTLPYAERKGSNLI